MANTQWMRFIVWWQWIVLMKPLKGTIRKGRAHYSEDVKLGTGSY